MTVMPMAMTSASFPAAESRPTPRPFRASRSEVEAIGTRPASPPPDVDDRLVAMCGVGTVLAVLMFVHGEEIIAFMM
jgi:hypothetical protein